MGWGGGGGSLGEVGRGSFWTHFFTSNCTRSGIVIVSKAAWWTGLVDLDMYGSRAEHIFIIGSYFCSL